MRQTNLEQESSFHYRGPISLASFRWKVPQSLALFEMIVDVFLPPDYPSYWPKKTSFQQITLKTSFKVGKESARVMNMLVFFRTVDEIDLYYSWLIREKFITYSILSGVWRFTGSLEIIFFSNSASYKTHKITRIPICNHLRFHKHRSLHSSWPSYPFL